MAALILPIKVATWEKVNRVSSFSALVQLDGGVSWGIHLQDCIVWLIIEKKSCRSHAMAEIPVSSSGKKANSHILHQYGACLLFLQLLD